jgi:peptidoglycan biosynthesis protein MviN/MurJ (putative lipid II flippase)
MVPEMYFRRQLARYGSSPAVLIGLTLATGAIFKLSAFVREAFIAARFGLSTVTDTYFGLQQFPFTLATFMFGAFALAFTPAYADARRRSGTVTWLPGLLFYGCLVGSALTALMLACAPYLLRIFAHAPTSGTRGTLEILSLCFVPIVCIGIWAGICTARGSNLWAMSMTGFPYLVMTAALLGLYAIGRLNNLGLPISMTIGFGAVGLYSLIRIVWSQRFPSNLKSMVSVWSLPEFRRFLRQLGASSVENCGFAGNQLLLVYFLAQAGTGMVSASICAMRIGLLGYSLLAQPLAILVQARLCSVESDARAALFRRWMLIVASGVLLTAPVLYSCRFLVIRLVYMHGKFQETQLNEVATILPAWIGYFVVMSLNAIVARYLFTGSKGTTYLRRQLMAYGAANLLRFAIAGRVGAASIVWCSVLAESWALVLNLRTCFGEMEPTTIVPALAATREAF